MKNTLLLLVSLVITANVCAQSEKNDLKLTVSALPLFGSSQTFESGINGYVIKPALGYYISPKTSIELNFTYATLDDLRVGRVDSYYNSYGFVPTLRNNFINNKKLRLFAEFGLGLGTIKYEADDNSLTNVQHQDLSGGIAMLNVGLGANFFFTPTFGLELIIPYINTRNITSDRSNNLYSGIGPTIGLSYVIN
ncbi:MAG: outer membrane beta-barrel protein [Dokdonia sp.]|jgi:hypothetical protein